MKLKTNNSEIITGLLLDCLYFWWSGTILTDKSQTQLQKRI